MKKTSRKPLVITAAAAAIVTILIAVGGYIILSISGNESWKVYTKTNPRFSYQVEYPLDWSWEEGGNVTYFLPTEAISNQESISIVIINYSETPPLGVEYTFTTIRTVQLGDEKILVQEREPSSVTELYISEITKGDYTAEFRFYLDRKYDEVFDHMVSTFKFTK